MRKLYVKSLQDNKEIIFPVTPFTTWKTGLNKTSVDLYGFGEVGTGATPKLATWICESFFPNSVNDYDFLVTNNLGTTYYINWLYRWQQEQHILQFKYADDNGRGISTWNCKIDTFEWGEKDGSMDIFYTLGFTEYKELKLDGLYINRNNEINISKGKIYIVKSNDTLITIATKVYGNSNKYKQLMINNNIANPLDIKVGQTLKI